jgi:aryl sulfotransferase
MDGWSNHPYSRVAYKGDITDTDRWDQFPHEPGDIFVCTPSKNGTTWMQTIVSFLLFGKSELDFVPAERSPWWDMSIMPLEDAQATLMWDNERNVIKTHSPLDGIPFFEDATYIGVYRDPRDAFFSMRNHADNMVMDIGISGISAEDQWTSWVTEDFVPGDGERVLGYPVHHLKCLWDVKDRPNVHLFHYADMKGDLGREMARVAAAIGVEVGEDVLSELVQAATFSNMRANSEKFVPGGSQGFWKEPKEFLKKGKTGQWQGEISNELAAKFDVRLVELAGDELAAWLLEGSGE